MGQERPKGYRETIGPWLAKKEILAGLGVAPADMVVFDIGAYKGAYTQTYQRMWPDAEYHLFEPIPRMVAELQQIFAGQDKVHIVGQAIADQDMENSMFYEGGRDGEMSSLYTRPVEGRRYYRHILVEVPYRVQVTTLDNYVKEAGIKNVHLIKIDIHGAEGPLIDGAKKVLRYKKPAILYIELGFVPRYEGAWPYHRIATRLEEYGYTLFDLYDLGRCKVSRQLSFADAMFISKEARERVIDQYPEEWLQKSLQHAMGMPRG